MDEFQTAMVVGSAIIGGGIAKLSDAALKWYRTRHHMQSQEKDQDAVRAPMLSFIDKLQAQIFALQARMDKVQDENQREIRELLRRDAECRAENAAQKIENTMLKERVRALEAHVVVLEKSLRDLQARASS